MASPATYRWTCIFVLVLNFTGLCLDPKESHADPQPALSYWLLRAEDLAAQDKVAESKRAYEKALHLDPGNRFAMRGLLWLQVQDMASPERGQEGGQGTKSGLADGGKRKRLEYLLARFQTSAKSDKELWRVYAVGYLLLEQPTFALPWFALGFRRQPADLLWLSDWAGALRRAGRPTAAHRLVRRALRLLYPVAKKAAHKGQSALEHETVRTFVRLLRYEKGPENDTARLLRGLLGRDLDAAVVREILTLWRQPGDELELLRTRIYSAADTAALLLRLRGSSGALSASTSTSAAAVASAEAGAGAKKKESGAAGGTNDSAADEDDADDEQDDSGEDDTDVEEDADTDADEAAEAGAGAPAQSSATTSAPEVENDEVESTRHFAAAFGGEAHGLGGLIVESLQGRGDFSSGRLGLTLRLGYAYLSDSAASLADLGLQDGEFDLLGLARLRLRKGKVELGVGGNLRVTDSLAYGTLHGDYDVGYGLSLELNAGFNQVVDDTSRLRLAGVRDRVAAGIYYDLTQREFLNLIADWHRYESRERELLSNGYALYLEAGHRLLLSSPGWSVRVSGYFEQNRLAASLPAGLAAELDLDASEVSEIITPEFGMVGVGTTLRRGVPGVAPSDDHRLRLFADLWMGYLWPLHDFGFDMQLGLGLSERGLGELSISGFFSNSRSGGGSEGLSWGAGLRYVY